MSTSRLLTPKQVARALAVSESSVKRWCDKGVINTRYTAGGHRRIEISDLVRFARDSNQKMVDPESVGLPASSGHSGRVIDRAGDQLADALLAGDEEKCRLILLDLYLAEHSLSTICDQVISRTMGIVGDQWECGKAEVYQERLGCEIVLRTLNELRTLVQPKQPAGPIAIGGTPEGDQYSIATNLVEMILRESGWQATSLGHNLPFATLAAAIRDVRPQLVWLSCSHLDDEARFLEEYAALYDEFGLDVAFVVGGRALHEGLRRQMKFAAWCDSMAHLESFSVSHLAALNRQQAST